MEDEDGYYFQKLGMHQGKKGVCERYGFQASLTVINSSTRSHERCNSDASGETSAVCRCAYYYFWVLFISYYFIIFAFDKNQVMWIVSFKTKIVQ